MSTAVGIVVSEGHRQPGHPEKPERIVEILKLLRESGDLARLRNVDITSAKPEQLARVHTAELIRQVQSAADRGGVQLDADTYTTAASYRAAIEAAGTTSAVLDQVMAGYVDNGMAIVRPPGHHASADRIGGFCLFNNIALAARQAQVVHGAERILIVDYDVHHGNGTQDIFYNDPSVLFVSIHQYGYFFYPGSGGLDEIGSGPGKGYTINVPFPGGAGDSWYRKTFEELIWPKARTFSPDLILVSVGFDAHWSDPLASASLSLTGYSQLAKILVDMAGELCSGKIVFILEGGYQLSALSYGVQNTLYRLQGMDQLTDPLGLSPYTEVDMTSVLAKLKGLHLLK